MNRKPGDWDCPKCGDVVFASRSKCRLCSTAKPVGDGDEDEEEIQTTPQGWGGRNVTRKPGDWDCPECDDHNFASRRVCRQCQTPKPGGSGGSGGGYKSGGYRSNVQMKAGDWKCSHCGDLVFAFRNKCRVCHTPKGDDVEVIGEQMREGDWKCDKCGDLVFASRDKCRVCQNPKPDAAETSD